MDSSIIGILLRQRCKCDLVSSAPAVSINCLKLPLTILPVLTQADNHFLIKTQQFNSVYMFGLKVSVHNSEILQRKTKPAISNTDQTPLASVNSSNDYSFSSQCYVIFLALILAHRKILQDKFLHWCLKVLLLTSVPWRLWTGKAYYKSAID